MLCQTPTRCLREAPGEWRRQVHKRSYLPNDGSDAILLAMKTLVTVILILACAGLFIALVINQKHIDEQRKKDADAILDFSNQVVAAKDELNDLRQVNLALTNDLNSSREQLVDLSNQMITISNSLSGQLASSDAQLKSAQDQIATLQSQNEALDQREADLTNTIDTLTAKINAAQMQLAE